MASTASTQTTVNFISRLHCEGCQNMVYRDKIERIACLWETGVLPFFMSGGYYFSR